MEPRALRAEPPRGLTGKVWRHQLPTLNLVGVLVLPAPPPLGLLCQEVVVAAGVELAGEWGQELASRGRICEKPEAGAAGRSSRHGRHRCRACHRPCHIDPGAQSRPHHAWPSRGHHLHRSQRWTGQAASATPTCQSAPPPWPLERPGSCTAAAACDRSLPAAGAALRRAAAYCMTTKEAKVCQVATCMAR
jgi:hypothetical protein